MSDNGKRRQLLMENERSFYCHDPTVLCSRRHATFVHRCVMEEHIKAVKETMTLSTEYRQKGFDLIEDNFGTQFIEGGQGAIDTFFMLKDVIKNSGGKEAMIQFMEKFYSLFPDNDRETIDMKMMEDMRR